jgi:undecaprenyl-diphosphatase
VTGRRRFAGYAAAAAALALFLYLSALVMTGEIPSFDRDVRAFVLSFASPGLTFAMRGITWLGSPAFLVSAVVMLVWRLVKRGRRRAAALLVLATLGGEAYDEALKLVFRRERPEAMFGYALPETYSFPSGHAVASACFFGTVAAILTRRMRSQTRKAAVWAMAVLVILAIGLSRVYLGVHHPSDVVGGYAAAVVWLALVRAGYERWLRRRMPVTAGSDA